MLGTRFNIRNDDSDHRITTVLLEGAVKAYASGDEKAAVRLRPSQQLVFDTRTGAMRRPTNLRPDRSIQLDRRPASASSTTPSGRSSPNSNATTTSISALWTKPLRSERFSGDFRVEDGIYHIMSVLQLTYKFNYRIVGNDIELYANPER